MRLLNASTYLLVALSVHTRPVGAAGLPPEDTTPSSKAENHDGEKTHLKDEIMSSSQDSIMGRLRGISRTIRASNSKEIDTASLLFDVKDIANTYSNEMKSFKQILEDEDREGIISMIKTSVGNSHDYIEAAKEIETGSDMDITSAIVLQDFDIDDLDDIPTADLVKVFKPVSDFIDHAIESSEGAVQTIDNVLGTFPSKKRRRNLYQELNFDFGQEEQGFTTNFHPFQGSFAAASSEDVLDSTSAIIRKHSPHLEESHEDRHDRRLESLKEDGSCLPPCSATDKLCNCKKLANCASQMSEYDLAVSIAGEFIETNINSDQFGNITEKLNLFDLTKGDESGLYDRHIEIQSLSKTVLSEGYSVDNDLNSCVQLLKQFVSACDPNISGAKCTQKNDETFPLSTDDVCNAVNTKVKLSFQSAYDNFDVFNLEVVSGRRDLEAISYNQVPSLHFCEKFVLDFNKIYTDRPKEDKIKYKDQNPMLTLDTFTGVPKLDPSNMPTGLKLLQQTTYITGYTFSTSGTGVKKWKGYQTSTHENIAVVGDGSASSSVDLDLAESILKDCDASLTFLAGHQVSAGAISDIASNIKEYGLPGTCCLDTPADYETSASESCTNHGSYHFSLSEEVCHLVNGKWKRGPCNLLQKCVRDYPQEGDSGYSKSFSDFAKDLHITDASDEDACKKARHALGFDKDYLNDAAICEQFMNLKCHQVFDDIDHVSGNTDEPTYGLLTYKPVKFKDPGLLPFTPLKNGTLKTVSDWGGRPAISGLSVTLQTLEASYVITQIVADATKAAIQLAIDASTPIDPKKIIYTGFMAAEITSITAAKSIQLTLINVIEYTLQGFVLNRPKYDRLGYENLNAHHKWVYESLHTIHVDIYNQNEKSRDQMVNLTEWAYNANNDYITCIANYLASGMGNVAKGHEVKSCASILPPDDLFTYSADELSNTRRRALRKRDASTFDPQWNGTLSEKIDAMEEQLKLLLDSQDSTNQTDYTLMLDALDKKLTAMDNNLTSNQQFLYDDLELTMYEMETWYHKRLATTEWVYNASNEYQACLTNMILTSLVGNGTDGVAVYECTPESFGTTKPNSPTVQGRDRVLKEDVDNGRNDEKVKKSLMDAHRESQDHIKAVEESMISMEGTITSTLTDIESAIAAIQLKLGMEPTLKADSKSRKSKKSSKKEIFNRKLLEDDSVGAEQEDSEDLDEIKVELVAVKNEVVVLKDEVKTAMKVKKGVTKEEMAEMKKEVNMVVREEVTALNGKISQLIEQNKATIEQNKELIEQNKELMAKVSASA